MDHKLIDVSEVVGKPLKFVYDVECGWRKYATDAVVPDERHLTNFKVLGHDRGGIHDKKPKKGEKIDLLVLDDYGNEHLPQDFEDSIFGRSPTESNSYTLAINRETGQTYHAQFGKERGQYILLISSLTTRSDCGMPKVPRHLLPRLDELLSKKRPFDLSLPSHLLMEYIERWRSKSDLQANLVVSLDLDGANLELWATYWRLVPDWKDVR
jgi:hypothetical protein